MPVIESTSIAGGNNNKYINAMKQSVRRGELAHSYSEGNQFSPVSLRNCKEWGMLNPSSFSSEGRRYRIDIHDLTNGRIALGFVRVEWSLLGLKSNDTAYALMSEDGVVLAWLENGGSDPYTSENISRLVKQGESSNKSYSWNRSLDKRLEAFKRKAYSEERARRAAIEKVEFMKRQKEREAAEMKRQKEREAALAAELAADKRTIEKFRANAKPLTEKQTAAINLALKTLYKSKDIILEFIQGSLKTEKLLVDLERWTIVVVERGGTKPRAVCFDVEVDDSGLLRDRVSVSKVRLKSL
ncbi:hypothetical protein N9208_04505 [Akkermansiaceae bacterium]|nr:hypothetical protein [Akkermansiaceae bacterium]